MRTAFRSPFSISLTLRTLITLICSIVIGLIGIISNFRTTLNYRPISITGSYVVKHSGSDAFTKHSQCSKIRSILDTSIWPKVKFHKDREPKSKHNSMFDEDLFSSPQEDNKQARKTIEEFNNLRSSVLTTRLIDSSLTLGNFYPAHAFANRFVESSLSPYARPLNVAIFGTSFTIGSNCGESSAQEGVDCAWPERLTQRWKDLISDSFLFHNVSVTWRHFEENAQKSSNIAQKIPAILDEYHSKNVAPDVILLDNTIADLELEIFAWYEAVVRVFVNFFPNAVIISIIDAIPGLVNHSGNHERRFYKRLYQIQQHYGLTIIDLAKMVKISKVANHSTIDLIWPQSLHCVFLNGTKYLEDPDECEHILDPIFFNNFLPITRKTKCANYPENHPPWPTHQYVADSVMYALLRVLQRGLSCNDDEVDSSAPLVPTLPNTTVFSKGKIEQCSICLSPLFRIDAKMSKYANQSNLTSNKNDDDVVVTCGDWKWVTDKRNRSGWQSKKNGSIIRFRLKISKEPTISLTYMRSYENFGDIEVTFRALTKEDENFPLWGCDDVDKLKKAPSLRLQGDIPRFSLWDTTVFPSKIDYNDVNAHSAWKLLNKAVLSKMSSDVEFVDMYIRNPNTYKSRSRIKIQTVTSC